MYAHTKISIHNKTIYIESDCNIVPSLDFCLLIYVLIDAALAMILKLFFKDICIFLWVRYCNYTTSLTT